MQILILMLVMIAAAYFTSITIPRVNMVAKTKRLFDVIDDRKIHNGKIAPLGGVAVLIGFVAASVLGFYQQVVTDVVYIFSGALLVFFVGIKDDLVTISASRKTVIEILASIFIIILGDIRFTNLHGIFGIYDISYIPSVLFTLFVLLSLMNSYNLIDGVDGLSSGLGVIASLFLGTWFFITENLVYAFLAFALAGSLSAFFWFNNFSKKNKIFLGDNGSLVIGLLIAVFIINFNEKNSTTEFLYSIKAAPVISFALVSIPLVDTLRVMVIRLMQKRSPFSPDNNHIHHRLLLLVSKHIQVTTILILSAIFIVLVAFGSGYIFSNITNHFFFVMCFVLFFSFVPSILAKYAVTEKNLSGDIKVSE